MDRTEALEVKVAYLEKTVADLDEVLRDLFGRMERLEAEVEELRETRIALGDQEGEKPPHYG
jgi:uncharacterized coiled-coil protein SlyX